MLSLQEVGRSDYNFGRYYVYNINKKLNAIIFIGM